MKRPCPGGCGRAVSYHPQSELSMRCPSCIALVKAQVERHAALWAPILMASMAMNGGRMPEIHPSLLHPSEPERRSA